MNKLIKFELLKQFKKKSIIYLLVTIFFISILNIYLSNKNYNWTENNEYNYVKFISEDNFKGNYSIYEKTTKDYNAFVRKNIFKYNYYKSHNLERNDKAKRILDTSVIVLVFSIIGVSFISSGILSDEINNKSIKELITKPYLRREILTSKLMCLFIIVFLIVLIVSITSVITSSILLKINWASIKEIFIFNGKVHVWNYLIEYYKIIFINSIPLCFIATFCLTISTIVNNSKLISGVAIFFSLMGPLILQLFLKLGFNLVQFTFIPYLDLSIYNNIYNIYTINILYGVSISLEKGIIILVINILIFYLIGTFIFNKKDINY